MQPVSKEQIETLVAEGMILKVIPLKKNCGAITRRGANATGTEHDVLVKGQNPFWVEALTQRGRENLSKAAIYVGIG